MPVNKPLKDFYHSQDLNYSTGFDIHKRRAEQQKPFDLNKLVYYGDQRDSQNKNPDNFPDQASFRDPDSIKRIKYQKGKFAKGSSAAYNNGVPMSDDTSLNMYNIKSMSTAAGPGLALKQAGALSRDSVRRATEKGPVNDLKQIREASVETSLRVSRAGNTLSRDKPRPTNFIRQNKILANTRQRFKDELQQQCESNPSSIVTGPSSVMKSVNVKNSLNSPGADKTNRDQVATLESEREVAIEENRRVQMKINTSSEHARKKPSQNARELKSLAVTSRAPNIPCYTPIQHPAGKIVNPRTVVTQEDVPESTSAVVLPSIMEKQKLEIKLIQEGKVKAIKDLQVKRQDITTKPSEKGGANSRMLERGEARRAELEEARKKRLADAAAKLEEET